MGGERPGGEEKEEERRMTRGVFRLGGKETKESLRREAELRLFLSRESGGFGWVPGGFRGRDSELPTQFSGRPSSTRPKFNVHSDNVLFHARPNKTKKDYSNIFFISSSSLSLN